MPFNFELCSVRIGENKNSAPEVGLEPTIHRGGLTAGIPHGVTFLGGTKTSKNWLLR